MALLQQWRDTAYSQDMDKNTAQRFWGTYFELEKNFTKNKKLLVQFVKKRKSEEMIHVHVEVVKSIKNAVVNSSW